MGVHDKLFRKLLESPRVADTLLRERLPPETVRAFAARPEAMPGSFVDRALKERLTDVLYRVRLRGRPRAFVYCLIEHKRTRERRVMLQLLRYLTAVYEALDRKFPREPLPVVIPLVVYNGTRRWSAPLRFKRLLVGAKSSTRLALDFGVVLVDLRTESAAKLSGDAVLRGGLSALKVAAAPRAEQRHLLREALRDLQADPSTLPVFIRYLEHVVAKEDRPQLERVLKEFESTGMITIADHAQAQGYRRGRLRGLEKGLERGLEKGLAEGTEQALRTSVIEVLRARFKKVSATVVEKVEKAPSGELHRLLQRAATVKRLGALFD